MIFRTQKIRGSAMAAALAVILALPVVAGAERFKPGDDTIADIAVGNGGFTTLVQALSCTGLVSAVANPDAELTVFAPTDDAFALAGLNAGNICSAYDTATLSTILLYHVVAERRPSPSVINGRNKSITMLAGGDIYPAGTGSLTLNANNSSVNIVAPDLLASNGIIHVIDFVLLP
jgi:uncharacterized surface protein with fasciclin (FAS1) repeats